MPPWRGGWRLVERRGPVALLVVPLAGGGRLARLSHPTASAVVLGSAQPARDFDAARCAAKGLGLVRRRSGGGAVLVSPGAQVWLDLYVPAGDPLFVGDVITSSSFVGALWREVLGAACGGGEGLAVHAGRLVTTPWSRRVCFSGLGPGEVTRDGAKVTGLAQRRDRAGAWFTTMALLRPEQHRLARLLAAGEGEAGELEASLRAGTAAAGCPAGSLEQALADALGGAWSAGEDVPAEPHPSEG